MSLSGCVPSNILRELREQTRPAHEALERKLDWAAICADQHAYRDVLVRFYGVVRPWEGLVRDAVAGTPLAAVFEDRNKADLLRQDLLSLGMSSEEIASIDHVSAADIPHASVPELLGAAYVMEGSTLGGQIIARTVAQELKLPDSYGVLYFSSYGTRVGSMWKAFGAVLQQNLVSEKDRGLAIRAASNMFGVMDEWLSGVVA